MALTFATLAEIAQRRVLLGLGAYWDPLAWKQGIERRRPVAQMREYVAVTKRLLSLETVTFEGDLVQVRDLRLELGFGVPEVPIEVPIYLGATGPKMLQLAGQVADGVLLNGFTSLVYQAEALDHIASAAAEVGRSLDDLDLPQTVVVSMHDYVEQATETARKATAMYLGQQPHIARASGIEPDLLEAVAKALGGWSPSENGIDRAARLVPDEVVHALTVTGTPQEYKDQVARYVTRNNIYPAILPISETFDEMVEVFAPDP